MRVDQGKTELEMGRWRRVRERMGRGRAGRCGIFGGYAGMSRADWDRLAALW